MKHIGSVVSKIKENPLKYILIFIVLLAIVRFVDINFITGSDTVRIESKAYDPTVFMGCYDRSFVTDKGETFLLMNCGIDVNPYWPDTEGMYSRIQIGREYKVYYYGSDISKYLLLGRKTVYNLSEV